MRVSQKVKVRYGRGNLAKARAALAAGDVLAAARFSIKHSANRQRQARSKQ